MNDPVLVGWIHRRLLHACVRARQQDQAGVEAVQPGLHRCVLTAVGETWDSSWRGYHSDVMGEAARGRAGGPPSPQRGGENVTDCRLSSGGDGVRFGLLPSSLLPD